MKKLLVCTSAVAALAAAAAILVQPATGAGNGIVASATGSGQATGVQVGGERRTFTFGARKYANGSVKGHMQVVSRLSDFHVHAALDCLVVSGNKAYMSGTILTSDLPGFVGVGFALAVQDNGEGAGAPTDLMTLFWYVAPPQACSMGIWQAFLDTVLFPLDGGNVQVH
jgi:hypothetical protein